jgi:hypothetical protein
MRKHALASAPAGAAAALAAAPSGAAHGVAGAAAAAFDTREAHVSISG